MVTCRIIEVLGISCMLLGKISRYGERENREGKLTNVMSSFMNIKYHNVDGVRFYSEERFRFLRGLMNSRFLLQ